MKAKSYYLLIGITLLSIFNLHAQVSNFNHPPIILGQKDFTLRTGKTFRITPDLLIIHDMDGLENNKFQVIIEKGNNYKLKSKNQIEITSNTCGKIKVPVKITDGFSTSNSYNLILCCKNLESKVNIYVSPKGKDSNNGSINKPLKSMEGARKWIQNYKEKNGLPENGITVYFKGGDYHINNTIVFNKDDSGEFEKPIRFCSYNNEKVRFTGAKNIKYEWFTTASKKITDRITDKSIRSKIKMLDLKKHSLNDIGIMDNVGYGVRKKPIPTSNIFIDGKSLHIARYPNNENFDDISKPNGKREFYSKTKRVCQWAKSDNIWIDGAVSKAWEWMKNRIESISDDGKITMVWDFHNNISTDRPKMFYYNVLEELDYPGEFFIDNKKMKMYIYLPDSVNSKNEICMSQSDKLILKLNNTKYLSFEGIDFYGTRNSAIEITKNSSNNLIKNSIISCCGLNGITIIGKENRILNCEISNVGANGIYIMGGDFSKLIPAGNIVDSCKIHDFSQERRAYNPGIVLNGVGQVIRNSELYNGPHMALTISGNNHLIEYSDFHDAPKEYSDMLAVYMNTGDNPLNRGTIIRRNKFHDVNGTWKQSAGVYLDNETSGVLVERNYFYNNNAQENGWSVMIHGGADNVVRGNLFVNCNYPFCISTRLNGYAKNEFEGKLHKWEKVFQKAPICYFENYPELNCYFNDEGVKPQKNDFIYHINKNEKGEVTNYWERRVPSTNVFQDNIVSNDINNPYRMPATNIKSNIENRGFYTTGAFRIKDGIRQDNLIHSGNIEIKNR